MNFRCEYCGQVGNHHYRCPNYKQKIKKQYYCCECSEPIEIGDEFLENDNGEYIHRECISGIMWLTDFLGYKFKEMEDFNDDEEKFVGFVIWS